MRIIVVAPHQDDEVLAAGGLIQKCIKLGDEVSVLFATNGDYHGPEVAKLRYHESRAAAALFGLPEENLYYLGYGDTGGMHRSHSFLRKLLFSKHIPLSTPFSTSTYHPGSKSTVRAMRVGMESAMTCNSLLSDIEWIIATTKPDMMVMPHPKDMHGDHSTLYPLIRNINAFKDIPIILYYIIHGGNDNYWPNREAKTFTRPPVIQQEEWDAHISIQLTEEEQQCKHTAISFFSTQIKDDSTGFLMSFAKQDEVFFLLENNIANRQSIYNHFGYKEMP